MPNQLEQLKVTLLDKAPASEEADAMEHPLTQPDAGGVADLDPTGEPGDPPEPVPEPMTMLLFGSGLAGIAYRYRRRKGDGDDEEETEETSAV